MAGKPKSDLPSTEKGKIQKWLELRLIINKAEPLKKALQPFIKQWLEKAPEKMRQFGTSTISLSEFPKKYFNLEKAEEALGKDALAPFWEEREESRINVK